MHIDRDRQNEETEAYVPNKEQGKSPERDLNKTEISYLPEKEIKVMVIEMLTDHRRVNEHRENFNREIENIRNYQTKVTVELKNTPESFNSRVDEMKYDCVSWKTAMENIQAEQQNEEKNFKK